MKNSVFVILFNTLCLFAQAQTGSVSGKIIDESTGEELVGAVIQIDSLGLGAASDLFGDYHIKNIPAGAHSFSVSYISYQTKKITTVIIAPNKNTILDVALTNAPLETGTVNIVDFKKTNTDAAVLMEMKDAQGVLSGISGKQIAKSQDADAAAVAKRIPGVTIVDNRFVMVRGLQERYNAVMLNGALAPSLETDVKSFSFDLIPSNLIDRFLIYKSPSPDLQGEFAGGAINVITKDFPENPFEVKASYMAGSRSGTTGELFRNNEVLKNDWIGRGAKDRALPASIPENVRYANSTQIESLGKSLRNSWGTQEILAPLDTRVNLSIGKSMNIGNAKIGSTTAISYSRTFQFVESHLANYNVYDIKNDQSDTTEFYTDSIFSNTNRIGLMQNFGFKSTHHEISFKNFFNQTGLSENTYRNGIDQQNGIKRRSYQFRYMERSLYTGQLSGKHSLFGNLGELCWLGGYNEVNRDEPDIRRIIYQQPLDDLTIPYQAVVAPSAQPFYLGRLFMHMNERSIVASASYQHYLNILHSESADKKKMISLKFGFYHQQKNRTFEIRNLGYKSNIHFDYDLTSLPVDEILNENNISNNGGFILDEDTKGSDQYQAKNKLLAYYGMIIIPIGKLNITGGVRIENNTQTLSSRTIQNKPVEVSKNVVSVLPSANLTYNFTEKMLLRAAYGKTLNRPEFRELAPFSFYDFVQNFVIQGNPELSVPVITNYDLRWEFYPNPSEFLSAGIFYKDFQHPIELSLDPTSTPWSVDPYNAFHATSYGAEVDIRKSAKDLSQNRWVGDFSLVANASYIKSEVTIKEGISTTENTKSRSMMFQSPYVVNAGIYFQDDSLDISFNALYNILGPRLYLAGINGLPDVYDMPRNVIDLSLTVGSGLITRGKYTNLKLRIGVQDVLNQKYLLLQDANNTDGLARENDQVRQSYYKGTYFTFGLQYEFSKK